MQPLSARDVLMHLVVSGRLSVFWRTLLSELFFGVREIGSRTHNGKRYFGDRRTAPSHPRSHTRDGFFGGRGDCTSGSPPSH